MSIVSLEDAQANLPKLIDALKPGETLIITRDDRPVANLTATAPTERRPRVPGTLKGTVLYMAPDFDAPLDDFKEYME